MKKIIGRANTNLQLNEWAYQEHLAGAVIDEDTGEAL